MSTAFGTHRSHSSGPKIIEEGYLVEQTTTDPQTGESHRLTSWMSKHDVSAEVIRVWESTRVGRGRLHGPAQEAHALPTDQNQVATDRTVRPALYTTNARDSERPKVEGYSVAPRLVVTSVSENVQAESAAKRTSSPSKGVSTTQQYAAPRKQNVPTKKRKLNPKAALFIPSKHTGQKDPAAPAHAATARESEKGDTVDTEQQELRPNALGLFLIHSEPRTERHWLVDKELSQSNKYVGVVAEVQGSSGDDQSPAWADGTFEGHRGTILAVVWEYKPSAETTATIKFKNGMVANAVPVQHLVRVPPDAEDQYALVLTGKRKGKLAKMREEMEGKWFVSIGSKDLFEIETDALALVDADEKGNIRT